MKRNADKSAKTSQAVKDGRATSRRSGPIRFDATLRTAGGRSILRLPEAASKKLSLRGQVSVHGALNGHTFQTVLEPEGKFGHWMRGDGRLQKAAGVGAGDSARAPVASPDSYELERDLAVEIRVVRPKDNAHAALTELAKDHVPTDFSTRLVGHDLRRDVPHRRRRGRRVAVGYFERC